MIVVVGLSHREAPLDVREKLAVDAEAVTNLLRALVAGGRVREALCVSTCNRIEIFAATSRDEDTESTARDVHEALVETAGTSGARVAPFLRTHLRRDAVRHLFRVASSLDSLVIGEPQILGQVRDALETAKTAGTIGKLLDRATSRALHVAKRVRSETAIGEGQVSVASVAVDLARQIFGELGGRSALLVGAGEMAEGAAKQIVKAGAGLVVVNRSPERAEALAAEFGGTARRWEDLESALVHTDVVIASTSARGFVLTKPMIQKAMKARRGRSLFFIDIAVPRDIEPGVNDLDNVYLYDIDNLSSLVAESMRGRMNEAERAETLVEHEAKVFETWTERLGVTTTIVALRSKVRASLGAELERTLTGRLKHLPDADKKALETMIEASVNKLLHTPTTRIKALAGDPQADQLVETVRHLFDLEQAVRDLDTAQRDAPLGQADDDPSSPTEVSEPDLVAMSTTPPGRENVGR